MRVYLAIDEPDGGGAALIAVEEGGNGVTRKTKHRAGRSKKRAADVDAAAAHGPFAHSCIPCPPSPAMATAIANARRNVLGLVCTGLLSAGACAALTAAPSWLLDFRLKADYAASGALLYDFVAARGATEVISIPFASVVLLLAVLASGSAVVSYFPAFRYARAFFIVTGRWQYSSRHPASAWARACAYVHTFLTLALPALWIKPLCEDWIVNDTTVFTHDDFASFRLLVLLSLLALRAALFSASVQSYLDQAWFVTQSLADKQLAFVRATADTATKFFAHFRVSAALMWAVPFMFVAAPVTMLMRRGAAVSGLCAVLFGRNQCGTSAVAGSTAAPGSAVTWHLLENNPFLVAAIEYLLFCHCLAFAATFAVALARVYWQEK